jgi:hypothetical protein
MEFRVFRNDGNSAIFNRKSRVNGTCRGLSGTACSDIAGVPAESPIADTELDDRRGRDGPTAGSCNATNWRYLLNSRPTTTHRGYVAVHHLPLLFREHYEKTRTLNPIGPSEDSCAGTSPPNIQSDRRRIVGYRA